MLYITDIYSIGVVDHNDRIYLDDILIMVALYGEDCSIEPTQPQMFYK